MEKLDIKTFNHFLVKEDDLPERKGDVNFLNEEKTDFNEPVLAIFREIFEFYSKDGIMTREKLAKFTSKATEISYCPEDDERVD